MIGVIFVDQFANSIRHGANALCHIIQEGNRIDKIRDASRHRFVLGRYELGAQVLSRYTGDYDGASNVWRRHLRLHRPLRRRHLVYWLDSRPTTQDTRAQRRTRRPLHATAWTGRSCLLGRASQPLGSSETRSGDQTPGTDLQGAPGAWRRQRPVTGIRHRHVAPRVENPKALPKVTGC